MDVDVLQLAHVSYFKLELVVRDYQYILFLFIVSSSVQCSGVFCILGEYVFTHHIFLKYCETKGICFIRSKREEPR